MTEKLKLLREVYRPKESEIKASILRFLDLKRIESWPTHNGPFMPLKRCRGIPDIMGMLPGNARTLGIEVKVPGEKPTPQQQAWLDKINKSGGVAFFASSVEEVATKLQIKYP
jgi:hypothetical protein